MDIILWFNRVQTSFLFLLCLGILLYQGNKCIERYLQKDTSVTMKIENVREVTFPAFSICPYYENVYKPEILKKYNLTVAEYRSGRYPESVSSKDLNDFHTMVTRNLSEILQHIILTTVYFNSNGSKQTIIGPDEKNFWFTHNHITLGRCYSFEVPKSIVSLEIKDIIFFIYDSSYIYFGHPGQLKMPKLKKMQSTRGKMTFLDLEHEVIVLKENDDPTIGHTCNHAMNHEFDNCFLEKAADALYKEFGCIDKLYIPPSSTYPVCDAYKVNISSQFRLFDFYQNLRYQGDICPPPCETISTYLGVPSFNGYDANNSYIQLYFTRDVKVWNFVYNYSFLTMVAEIGGYTGLFLGFSCYQLSAVISMLLEKIRQF